MTTGYDAYSIFHTVTKVHFSKSKFNCMKNNKGFRDKRFLKKWNEEKYKDGRSRFYAEIEEKYSHPYTLKLLFSIYYLKDSNYFVNSIIEDDFALFKEYVYELKHIEKVFTIELENVIMNCKKDKIKFKDIFVAKAGIPEIFKFDLSYNILVILNRIFDIAKLNVNNKLNSLEEGEYYEVLIKLNKYNLIIDRFIKNIDWLKLLKLTYKKCHTQ